MTQDIQMEEKDSEPVIINPDNCRRCHHSIELENKRIRCKNPNPKTRQENHHWICFSFK